jgi:hypothetical protein
VPFFNAFGGEILTFQALGKGRNFEKTALIKRDSKRHNEYNYIFEGAVKTIFLALLMLP